MYIEPKVGMLLYGSCEGLFGREYFNDGIRIEAVGYDWMVGREPSGALNFATAYKLGEAIKVKTEWLEDQTW